MTNEAQIDYWNGETGNHWAEEAEAMDSLLAGISDSILARAQLSQGERVLDIGCGSGALTLAAQQQVGDTGRAIGVDVSAQLLENAKRRRVISPHLCATFVKADAASWRPDARVDVVLSRFGVMFFDQPTTAFANILQSTQPNGRLIFACWRSPRENDMASGLMQAVAHVFPTPSEQPDPRAPGPFAFSDRAYVSDLLTTAGWRDIDFQTWDGALPLPSASVEGNANWLTKLGSVARLRREHPAVPLDSITAAITPFLLTRRLDTGFALQGAAWIVSARAAH